MKTNSLTRKKCIRNRSVSTKITTTCLHDHERPKGNSHTKDVIQTVQKKLHTVNVVYILHNIFWNFYHPPLERGMFLSNTPQHKMIVGIIIIRCQTHLIWCSDLCSIDVLCDLQPDHVVGMVQTKVPFE